MTPTRAPAVAWTPPLARTPRSLSRERSTVLARLLRVPLFVKLLAAQTVTVLGLGSLTVLLASRAAQPGGSFALAAILALCLGILAVGALANALVLRLALTPIEGLEQAARRVREGDFSARAPHSPVADEGIGRVITLFNDVLDSAEQERGRRSEGSQRVLQAEERERERLAQELYDSTAQTLAGVLVRMSVVRRIRDVQQGRALLEEVREEVARALEEVRTMARRLHPPELTDLGVVAALEAHGRVLCEEGPMRVELRGEVPEARLSPDALLAIFRIVQEALSNAVLHSGGRRVSVSFLPGPEGLTVDVTDDGTGFDPERVLLTGSGGLGLLGMRERAGYVSGTLEVRSGEGGTRVRLHVPWRTPPPA